MIPENDYDDSAAASEGLSVPKRKKRKAKKGGDSKDQNEIPLSCNYYCLMVCAVLILLLNLVLVIVSFVQSNRSLYYSIAGYENIDVKWFLVLFTLIAASVLSAAIIFLSFLARHPLELLNVAVIAGISIMSYLVLIPVWYIVSTGPLNNLQSNMMESLEHAYKGEISWHLPSISWNYIQVFHQKCGVKSSDDWSESNWIDDGTEQPQSIHVPVYCCAQLDKDEISEEVLDHELTSEDLESLKSSCFGSNRKASVQEARERKVADYSEVGKQELSVKSTQFIPPHYKMVPSEYSRQKNVSIHSNDKKMTTVEPLELPSWAYVIPTIAPTLPTTLKINSPTTSRSTSKTTSPTTSTTTSKTTSPTTSKNTSPTISRTTSKTTMKSTQFIPPDYKLVPSEYSRQNVSIQPTDEKFMTVEPLELPSWAYVIPTTAPTSPTTSKTSSSTTSRTTSKTTSPTTSTTTSKTTSPTTSTTTSKTTSPTTSTTTSKTTSPTTSTTTSKTTSPTTSTTASKDTSPIISTKTSKTASLTTSMTSKTTSPTTMKTTLAKNQDNGVVLGKTTTFEKSSAEVTTSWTRPDRKQSEDARQTSFKKFQIPQHNRRVKPFNQIQHWRDVFGTVEATYYTPTFLNTHFQYTTAVRWYEALEYCQYYLPYKYPNEDFESRPPGMAVGFSAQEVEFLISLPVFESNSEAPHLGFYRPENKPFKASMTVHAYRNITVPVHNYYSDFWKTRGNKYGCLHRYGRRDTCSNNYPMRYICARYLRVEKRLPQKELPYIHSMYYQRHLNDTILGEYWILDIPESFVEAHVRCNAFFGPGFAVAVGYDQGELSFLAELIKLVDLSGTYFHLGFYRYYPEPYYYSLPPRVDGREKNQVFFNVSFAHLWAPKNPGRTTSRRPENFGCVDKKTRGHADSYTEREDKFVCALYDKIPEDPFNEKYRFSNTVPRILPFIPFFRKLPVVERDTLTSGKITGEKEGDSMFDRIYDWEDAFGFTKARFFIPRYRKLATWPEADKFCREIVPLFHEDFDYSEKPAGLAVGWTTEELMMLKEIFSQQSLPMPHLGFHHEDVADKSLQMNQFRVYVGDKSLTLGNHRDVYGGRFNRTKNYDMWAEDQPQFRKGELYGCMVVKRGAREDCKGTNKGSLICANYTMVEPTDPRPDTLLHKSEDHYFHDADRDLPEMPPTLYYERYVNDRLFAQYFLLNHTFKRHSADKVCQLKFGKGFGLAVGFNRAEMEFLRKTFVEMYMRGWLLFLGYSREENQKYFTTQPYEIPIGTLWAKGEPHHRTTRGGYGCMSIEGGYLSRAECEPDPNAKRSFACAVYEEIPHQVEYWNQKDDAVAASEQNLMGVEPRQANVSDFLNDEGCLAVVKSKIMIYSLPITGILVANCVLLIFIFVFSVITFCRSYLCYPGSIAA